jgi:hypothetical protein
MADTRLGVRKSRVSQRRYGRTGRLSRFSGNEFAYPLLEGGVCRVRGGVMPSSNYYRVQSKVLLMLMLAMRDSDRAEYVEAKAREYLVQADLPQDDVHELNLLLEEFNNSQLRNGRPREG